MKDDLKKPGEKHKKILIFGAGKIGRSFIGQLFSLGGYEVVFIDTNKTLINEINRRHNYNVVIKGDVETLINVKNVSGIHLGDTTEILNEIAAADLMTVCVGAAGLNSVLSLIAQGLIRRDMLANSNPVDIIIAENLRNAAQYFETELRKLLPDAYPFESNVGLIETSIGKMVPIMHKKDTEVDLLQIFAEPYNTLILDRIAFKNPIPEIRGLAPKNNMKAWVDCKLFIHNLGHASSAYLGHLHNRNFIYIYEALSVSEIYNQVRETMIQSSRILLKKYPDDFTETFLIGHVDDLLFRFRNKALGDTIFRVGCDLFRKLGPEDRLAGCIKMALELDMPYEKILFALICACRFRATDEEGALLPADYEFAGSFDGNIERVLAEVCYFDPVKEIKVFIEAREMETAVAEFL